MASAQFPLTTSPCPIDIDCTGERWVVNNVVELSRHIAIIAMGQAAQAAHILQELSPAAPAFTTSELRAEAKVRLTVQEEKQSPRIGYPRWQRDGFIFEAISWIAARQVYGAGCFMKDPHISATAQGLDGLMLELSTDKSDVQRTTVFEDKCSDDPIGTFQYKVIPAFQDRHDNKRSAEIVSVATVLLRMAGISEGDAAKLAAAVTDRGRRRYRAAMAVTDASDSQHARTEIFANYAKIKDVTQGQRIGACFVVPPELRDWFERLAQEAVSYIDSFEGEVGDV
ncbi:hypothetical protein GCM10023219_19780 [Stakelama sediminis]|uniref:Anti-bacteriophage protein A/HamA C-terminal domain-containing protein n=1 Tax=Stakelama sediminis TaxID=463200 RepID=A0A840Z1V9_9SPHN|nr:hypothetical protein [Stakelama sediminis]MBB5720121.1 hypothetical protein [Stakelama sediminis]